MTMDSSTSSAPIKKSEKVIPLAPPSPMNKSEKAVPFVPPSSLESNKDEIKNDKKSDGDGDDLDDVKKSAQVKKGSEKNEIVVVNKKQRNSNNDDNSNNNDNTAISSDETDASDNENTNIKVDTKIIKNEKEENIKMINNDQQQQQQEQDDADVVVEQLEGKKAGATEEIPVAFGDATKKPPRMTSADDYTMLEEGYKPNDEDVICSWARQNVSKSLV